MGRDDRAERLRKTVQERARARLAEFVASEGSPTV
jgi:hypothetical protein